VAYAYNDPRTQTAYLFLLTQTSPLHFAVFLRRNLGVAQLSVLRILLLAIAILFAGMVRVFLLPLSALAIAAIPFRPPMWEIFPVLGWLYESVDAFAPHYRTYLSANAGSVPPDFVVFALIFVIFALWQRQQTATFNRHNASEPIHSNGLGEPLLAPAHHFFAYIALEPIVLLCAGVGYAYLSFLIPVLSPHFAAFVILGAFVSLANALALQMGITRHHRAVQDQYLESQHQQEQFGHLASQPHSEAPPRPKAQAILYDPEGE